MAERDRQGALGSWETRNGRQVRSDRSGSVVCDAGRVQQWMTRRTSPYY